MKALVCEGGVLEVRDVPDPTPGRGQLVLDVLACGICGSDLHARHHCDDLAEAAATAGYTDFMRSDEAVVMGHEFAGTVRAAGSHTKTREGTAVVAMPIVRGVGRAGGVHLTGLTTKAPGGYAEQVLVQESLTFE
ncbi:MAG: alcohol dehydrogenase catalytic domain-containing protein, partial [Nocardioides sp.]